MTPNEVRRRIRLLNELADGGPTMGFRFALALDVLHAIAEGCCTHPAICAKELVSAEGFKP